MQVLKIAAFSDGDVGGNPAGVVIENQLPTREEMRSIAADVGYSETVFAAQEGSNWRVRYFSPESEVPFCGHATIALGAALAQKFGDGNFVLNLQDTTISVQGSKKNGKLFAALQSPATSSQPAEKNVVDAALLLFGYQRDDLSSRVQPAIIRAGATHLLLMLNSRKKLAAMNYDLNAGRNFMRKNELVTVSLVFAQSEQLFNVRNPFASGGVFEDPATGAAAAALAGHLRKINWPHGGEIDIVQGEDMGERSLIKAELKSEAQSSIRISGAARLI
ncbi:MAG: PhzF family phenazine biosynthesis protein [Devosiaceae bacterium]|nr:PhzF family phenazine biosynthesis protein [Devosiaceae bacterium]